jgi:2,3-bisphosphoglycerate-dependent phosphoglycerate mutase
VANTKPTCLLLVRHAESKPSADIPETEWPLSELGVRQAKELASELKKHAISVVYSSPYPRAIATVQPFADECGIKVITHVDLRERKLHDGFLDNDNWKEALERTWNDFDLVFPGGESTRHCQIRVVAALREIAAKHVGERIAIGSHGNAIATALNFADKSFGHAGWKAMKNPDLFQVTVSADGGFEWQRNR